MRFHVLLLVALLTSLGAIQCKTKTMSPQLINPAGTTIETRINPPEGYIRIAAKTGSFAAYLRSVKLKPSGAVVHYYNGDVKANNGVYVAVEDVQIGDKNLLQCADAVIYQRAMYLFAAGRKDEIRFTFTNGFKAGYNKWQLGYHIEVNGKDVQWVKNNPQASFDFRHYLDIVFTYCGTLSLSRELKPIDYREIAPGDVLIIGGSPGHAELVMDMAINKQGKKVYLLSQGHMPAQDIQILANPTNAGFSPWYELNVAQTVIKTPEYQFTTSNLKRF